MNKSKGLLAVVLLLFSLLSAAAQTITVTAPNGGQTWTAGSTYTITWTITGSTASINYQLVALSTDGGSTYANISVAQTPATRSFNWTIPAGTSTSQARIRVRALDVNTFILAQDASDSTFTISAPATIPASPTSLTASGGASSIVLAWQDNANNEQGFRIERKIGAGGTWGLYTTLGANATGYTDTGVVAGNTYYYRVYAYNATGPSQFYSNEASAALTGAIPGSPTSLTASGGTSSIGLAWQDNANNEQGFRIERKIGAGGTWGLYATVGANVTSYTDTGVVAGNTYYYRVYAYNATGPSQFYSNEASAAPTGTIPASPTSLTAVGGTSSIGLSWQDNANNEQGFRIERKIGAGGTWGLYTTVGANATGYTDTGVVAGNTYFYRVYAYNAVGPSQFYSNEASAGLTGSVPSVSTQPATSVGATSATLNGQIVSAGGSAILERRIEWTKSTGNWGTGTAGVDYGFFSDATTPFNVSGNNFSLSLTGFLPNTGYKYRVWARNSVGWSDVNVVNVETFQTSDGVPASPTSLTASGGANSIGLSWQDNANNEQGFRIERKIGAGGTWVLYATVATPNTTGYTDTGVVAGNTYFYRVYAYNAAGASQFYSNEASASLQLQTVPASPTLLTASGGTSSVGLAWQDNANNEQGFYIERKIGVGGTWGLYAAVGANVTGYTDTGVVAGNTYYYRVYAYNAVGPSPYYSNEAFATVTSSTVTLLQNGIPVGNLSGAQGNQRIYKITVPSGQAKLDISIAGGTGDCDLYVRFGSAPTTSNYDYRPYLGGNDESVSVSSPASGDWYVMLNGYSSYSGVTLLAGYSTVVSTVATPQISPGSGGYNNSVTVTMSTATAGANIYYTLNGSDPTTSSTLYGGAFTLTGNTTVKAKAFKSGMTASAIASQSYTINTSLTTLQNNVPIGNLTGAQGSQKFYKIIVPSGQTKLDISIANGTGDCDVYVKFGSAPTTSSFDQRPYLPGNNELVSVNNPTAGDWYVMVNSYNDYSGVTLLARYESIVVTKPDLLQNNTPVAGLSGASGSETFYRIVVPSGQTRLEIRTSGGSGDCDLYVKLGSKPTTATQSGLYSKVAGNQGFVSIDNPASGTWFIMLRGASSYSGVTLLARYGSSESANTFLRAGAQAVGLTSTLYQRYYSLNKKYLLFGAADLPIEVGGVTIYIDSADYLGITPEGWNDEWVTVWLRGSVGIGIGLPFSAGIDVRDFNSVDNLPDREFPFEVSWLNASIPGWAFTAIPLSSSGEVDGGLSVSPVFEYSASLLTMDTPSVSIEIQRSVLDAVITDGLAGGVAPNLVGNKLVTAVMNSSQSSKQNGQLSVVWNFLSSQLRFTNGDKTDAGN